MILVTSLILIVISAAIFSAGSAFVILSIVEGESRAARRGFLLTLTGTGLLLICLLLPENITLILIIGILGLFMLTGILIFLPSGKIKIELTEPDQRVDEREIIFARARLEPGTTNYEDYYKSHPDHKKPDDASRKQPGLLSPGARFTDPFHSAAAAGSFYLTGALRTAVDGPVGADKIKSSPEDLTRVIKKLAVYYGALDCGITQLRPGHIYSHIGRGTGTYGDIVDLNHRFGIAFTVEMDFQYTGSAPYPPITMESGRQYVESARVSVQLAAAIRELGYPARAHIDGNYRVIAPLVARDAGLGEIGRMGLLMTPHLGPRVRVGVVTTDMPLLIEHYQGSPSTINFCQICKKCAENCPSQSISKEERQVDNGVLRWKINPETCYHYWTIIGTDCGRCMAVCPFSHPDNWAHNLVRWGIRKSGTFRRAALILDDFFYGKKPPSRDKSVLP